MAKVHLVAQTGAVTKAKCGIVLGEADSLCATYEETTCKSCLRHKPGRKRKKK